MPYYIVIALVLLIVSAVITTLISKNPSSGGQPPDPATLKEFSFPQIAEGTPQTIVFGDKWLPDWQVLWYGNLQSVAIPAPQSSGGGKK